MKLLVFTSDDGRTIYLNREQIESVIPAGNGNKSMVSMISGAEWFVRGEPAEMAARVQGTAQQGSQQ